MANYNSVQYAQTQTTPHTLLDPTEAGGNIRCLWATIETTTDHDIADTFTWFTLPKNARPVAAWITADDEAASATLTLGDSTDPDGYMVATSIASGPTYLDCVATGGAYWLGDVGINSAETQVTSTIAGANLAGGATITVTMLYVQT